MAIKPDTEKKMAVGIYLATIFESTKFGFQDVNEYIDALKQQIIKLQNTQEIITKELENKTNLLKTKDQTIKELEARLKEKESAEEKEQR